MRPRCAQSRHSAIHALAPGGRPYAWLGICALAPPLISNLQVLSSSHIACKTNATCDAEERHTHHGCARRRHCRVLFEDRRLI